MRYIILSLLSILPLQGFSQNLFEERIRKIADFKSDSYVDGGVIIGGVQGVQSSLKAMRHSFDKNTGKERIVFDFDSASSPHIYGHLNSKKNVISIDFLKTKAGANLNSFGQTEFIKTVNVFPFSDGTLSTELLLAEGTSVEVFILNNPGRLVLDLKRKK